MKEKINAGLTDEYLESLEGITPAETSPFFYTRLMGRMQSQSQHVNFVKPAWAIFILCFFILMNIWMIGQEATEKPEANEASTTIEAFAETYNLYNDSNY